MDHVRIDEGVKRGPRRKTAPPKENKRFYSLQGSKSVAAEHKPLIIAQVASGRLMRDVAADLGVSPAAISQYLANDSDYQLAKERQNETYTRAMAYRDTPKQYRCH